MSRLMITTLPVASALLLADAPPLPVTTWWSLITRFSPCWPSPSDGSPFAAPRRRAA
jgi:hypothetical protein